MERGGDFPHRKTKRYSTDLAGNEEEVTGGTIKIDLKDPVVKAEKWREPGIGVVYLTAEDSESGVEKIEYKVNGGTPSAYETPIVLTEKGEYRIDYRAIDRAGRNSGWHLLKMEVEAFDKGEWVINPRYSYWKPRRVVVRKVRPGMRLYAPSSGKDNKIKMLPDYLIGADYFLTHNEDRHSKGKGFITFTAGADVDVYIIKHRRSEVDLSDWTLVEENFKIEPRHHFKEGGSIYRKSFHEGSIVSLPGSDAGRGWGNLYFVQYAKSNYVKIYNPVPGKGLKGGDVVRPLAEVLELTYDRIEWQSRLSENEWTEVKDSITLPEVETTTDWELKALVYQGSELVCEKVESYRIVNDQRIELQSPGAGSRLTPGETVEVEALVYDEFGEKVNDGLVNCFMSPDKVNWSKLGDKSLTAPEEEGMVYLKVKAGEQEEVFGLPVSRKPVERVVAFSPGNLGPVSLKANGNYYGFREDHSERGGEFFQISKEGFVRKWTAALKEGSSFRWLGGKGEHRVEIVFGPVYVGEEYRVAVNGKAFVVETRSYKREETRVIELTTEDGWIEITGEEGLPLSRVSLLEPEKPRDDRHKGKGRGKDDHGKDNRGNDDRGKGGKR